MLSRFRLCVEPVARRLLCPWTSPGKNTGVGSHFLFQRIFTTQGLNPGLPHCRQILYCSEPPGISKSQMNKISHRSQFPHMEMPLCSLGLLFCCPSSCPVIAAPQTVTGGLDIVLYVLLFLRATIQSVLSVVQWQVYPGAQVQTHFLVFPSLPSLFTH